MFEFYLSKLVRYCDVTLSYLCPDMAEKWTISQDGRTLTFFIRDMKWQDGSTVTADDVAFTIERQFNKVDSRYWNNFGAILGASGYDPAKGKLAGLTVVDAKTLKISLEKPQPALLDTLSFIGIVQKKQWEKVAPGDMDRSDIWKNGIIGSGPFIFSKYVPGQYVEFLPFADYYGGKPKVDKLINRYYPEAGTALVALQQGDIDFTYVTVGERDKVASNSGFRIIEGPSLVGQSIYLNLRIKGLDNVKARQAIMYRLH